MRERTIRLNRDRRERLWKWRQTAAVGFSRRTRFIIAVVAFFVLGVVLPLHHVVSKRDEDGSPQPDARAAESLGVLRTAIECFRSDCGRYPTEAEGLSALVLPPAAPGWRGPYILLLKPDPWRHPYVYICSNDTVRLFSAGPDRRPGTDDDVESSPPDYTYVNNPARTNAPPPRPSGEEPFVNIVTLPATNAPTR